MNSIVFTHFDPGFSGNVCRLEVALDRLGCYLDEEQETLVHMLAQADRWQAKQALEELAQLHLDADAGKTELRDLLEHAEIYLQFILDVVRRIPSRCRLVTATGLPGPNSFDQHVRWCGARLEDITLTLQRALAS